MFNNLEDIISNMQDVNTFKTIISKLKQATLLSTRTGVRLPRGGGGTGLKTVFVVIFNTNEKTLDFKVFCFLIQAL